MSLYYSLVDSSNSFCGLAVDCIAYVSEEGGDSLRAAKNNLQFPGC